MPASQQVAVLSSRFDPQWLPGLAARFDAMLRRVTIATGVSQWDDTSGNGRHLKQSTGSAQPTWNDGSYPYLSFDGSNDYLKCDAFTLSQPETIYFVGSQVTFTNNEYLFDGNSTDGGTIYQNTTSPNITIYAGSAGGTITNWALNERAAICAIFNGLQSSIRKNRDAANTGGAGANNMGGFTLGARGAATGGFTNMTANEILIFSVAHDEATQRKVLGYLIRKWSIAA